MCGIAGILTTDGTSPEHRVLAGMIDVLRHRGPDADGIWCAGPIGLAHTRLSIIDLAGGSQPMSTEDGRFCITFNGEIFNFLELRQELESQGVCFLTRSDTEVILHLYRLYGDGCVHKMNGQWAFAIWDSATRRLFLSRDRMGVRPLFYCRVPGAFLFGSEIKALFSHPGVERQLDFLGLQQALTFWTTIPPRTAFRGMFELPPGHSMVVQEGNTSVSKYWQLAYEPEGDAEEGTAARKAEELLSLLTDATRIRLRSDVPVGAYLSGGIDSTSITAIIRKLDTTRLRTFSVSFDDGEYDERRYQEEASAYLNTDHAEVRCSYSDIMKAFPAVLWHAEKPIIRTAPAPLFLLSRLVHESRFKVVLTGEGSDEVLGGYDVFKEAKIRRFLARYPDSNARAMLLKRLYPYMKNLQQQSPAYLRAWFHARPEETSSPFFSHVPRWELSKKLHKLFSPEMKQQLADVDEIGQLEAELPPGFSGWDGLSKAQYLETMHLLPGYILSSQGDRMAMAHAVEGRYPFLDHRVVEFAGRLHPNLKLKVLNEKYLLKRAVRNMIPESIRRRPKQPYRAPDGRSFFAPNTDPYVGDMLSPSVIQRNGVFDPGAISKLVEKFRKNNAIGVGDDMCLVGVLSTQLLADQFITNFRKMA